MEKTENKLSKLEQYALEALEELKNGEATELNSEFLTVILLKKK